MSFDDGEFGYSPVTAVRLPSWPTQRFFSRLTYFEAPSTRRILKESGGNKANTINGKVDRRRESGSVTTPPEVEDIKVEDYLRSKHPPNKSSHMMHLLFDSRPEPDADEKPIRLTESEYRSMTAQLRDARQVVAHSKSISNAGLTSTSKTHEICRATQLANCSPRSVRDKTPTWRPHLLQPCLLQQSFRGGAGGLSDHLSDSCVKKGSPDDVGLRHQIPIASKARLNPSRAVDPKLAMMIGQRPGTGTQVPGRDHPANKLSGDEDDHSMNPRGVLPSGGVDRDSDSTSSDDDDSRFFFQGQTTKSGQRRNRDDEEEEEELGEYRFATPLSDDVMRLDLTGMSRVDRDWRTLTNVRPKTQTEARMLDRLIQMERCQIQTVELENAGMRRPIRAGNNISSSSLLLQGPGRNATRSRAPSRRGGPDLMDNVTRKSNAPPASADVVCQQCLERHTVRSCAENVYASRSRSTIDFDKYERATPVPGSSNRMGPTVQGRSPNPPAAAGAVRVGRPKLTNASRAVRVNEYIGSTTASLQASQRVDECNSTLGGSISARTVDVPGDVIGAFKVLGLQICQSKVGGAGDYSSLKPALTGFEGSRTVAGPTTTAARGGSLGGVPTTSSGRKTPVVDAELRTLKAPLRLKSATRSLKPTSKRRPQTAAI